MIDLIEQDSGSALNYKPIINNIKVKFLLPSHFHNPKQVVLIYVLSMDVDFN